MHNIPDFTLLLLAAAMGAQAQVQVTVPNTLPQVVSDVVDHGFLSWAVESSSFPNYTNEFSSNIFNDFSARTGSPIILRVGGTSMDHSDFDLSLNEYSISQDPSKGLLSPLTFGAPWFESFKRLNNTKFILQVPVATHNMTNAVKFSRQCIESMGKSNLFSIEIGNEPDLYVPQGVQNSTYSVKEYVEQVHRYIGNITEQVETLPEGRIFQTFDKSSSSGTKATWNIEQFMGNMTKLVDLSRVQSVAQHYYQAQGGDELQSALLNHQQTISDTNDHFLDSVEYIRKNNNELKFIVSEVGNAIVKGDTRPSPQLSGSLGTSVWTVDWMLYSMTINITRVHMQQGRHFAFAAWQPVENPPYTQGGFYGHVFIADFIGNNVSTALRVKELKTGDESITAYAGFHDNELAKIALTNQQLWTKNDSLGAQKQRPSKKVQLDLGLSNAVRQVALRRLTGPFGDSLGNITWAGQDWTAESKGKPTPVNQTTQMVPVTNGSISVEIFATEALLITW